MNLLVLSHWRPCTGVACSLAAARWIYGVAGHSYVGLVEFGETPRAKSILVFGADADPDSPHYFDQARLFADRRYKDAWFQRDDVEANATDTLTLEYAP